jgi:hypothetical protein
MHCVLWWTERASCIGAADSPCACCARWAPTGRIGRLSSHLFCDSCTKQMTQTGLMLLKALIASAINEHGNWNTIIDRSLKIHNQQHDHSFLIIQTHHHYNNSTTQLHNAPSCMQLPKHILATSRPNLTQQDPSWRHGCRYVSFPRVSAAIQKNNWS